uniref:Uncharacterized protein n=1 Tax=Davidia involucrata TaxID=16924 RepID=A0A5B7BHC0_DAVIN
METEVATSGREARKRKIVERGSDRMALITGRIQTLASPSSSQPPHLLSHTQSSPARSFQDQFPQPPNPIDVGPKGEDDTSDPSLKHDIGDGFSRGNAFDFGSRVEPQLRKCETNVEAIRAPAEEIMNELQPSPVTARVPKAPVDMELVSEACGGHLNLFTPREINSCIMATEATRVFCSITIALLVVLSYINLPRNIVKSKSVIASRPLYILLITDVTIVLARLLLERRRGFEKAKEDEKIGLKEDGHNWAGAVKVLEMGLVFYQTVRAIFIDFSFYAVVVICGLSLM